MNTNAAILVLDRVNRARRLRFERNTGFACMGLTPKPHLRLHAKPGPERYPHFTGFSVSQIRLDMYGHGEEYLLTGTYWEEIPKIEWNHVAISVKR